MYLSKKFKKLGTGVVVLGLAVASCQLVGCSDSNVNGDEPGGATGKAGDAGEAGKSGSGSAGAPSGGRAGATGSAGESEPGSGNGGASGGGEIGGASGGGEIGGAPGAGAGGALGGMSGAPAGGAGGMSGSAGMSGNAGHGGTGGIAGGAGMAGAAGHAGTAGGAGMSGSAGTAGGAGTAGTAGTAGNGGAGGTSGSAGMAGSAGATATCGNGLKEAGEFCDPASYAVDDCGTDCKNITSAECFACENDVNTCQDFVSCSSLTGNAAAGTPAAGVPKANLCNEVLDCVRDSNCAKSNGIIKCYCGAASTTDCQAGLGNGKCKAQLERGLETTNFTQITQRLKSPQYGGGVAMARVDCDQQACAVECNVN